MNEDIIGGLRSALTRGYTLEEAMFSFFNAGYKKEDIEAAAKTLQIEAEPKEENWQPKPIWVTRQRLQGKTPSTVPSLITREKQRPTQSITPPQNEIVGVRPKVVQEISENKPTEIRRQAAASAVSKYSNTDSRVRTIIIILVILLILLLGILGMIFIFKQQVIGFFNNFF